MQRGLYRINQCIHAGKLLCVIQANINMSEVKLGYWNIRGLAEPIVLMLEYLDVKYCYKRYTAADMKNWFEKDKPSLDIDFANLPYFVDGDVKLSESLAIMRYIGRKFKALYPQNDEEEIKCDVAQGAVLDFRMDFARLSYSQDFEKLKDNFIEQLPNKLDKFEKVLTRSPWLTGIYPLHNFDFVSP